MNEKDWQAEIKKRDELWSGEIARSQELPKELCPGKVFTLCVADGKVLYKVTAVKKNQCQVTLVDGGPDHYADAVLGAGGWFPNRSIEPLVIRHHSMTELFSRPRPEAGL